MAKKPDCPCSECGKLLWTHSRTSRPAATRLCLDCRKARRGDRAHLQYFYPEQKCPGCGETFKPVVAGQAACSRSCGQKLRYSAITADQRRAARVDRWRRSNRRRRALKLSCRSEPYTTAEIAKRDRRRCGLCGGRVRMQELVPHPKAPVVDHVLPLARGGDDVRANVQLAHYRCNARKGAAGGGEQLALIG